MSELERQLSSILDKHQNSRALRTLETLDSGQGREIIIADRPLLNFSSNDYLGLSGHPNLLVAAQEAAARYGVGSGASALLSGRSRAHVELETQLATFLGRERALLYSSGYLANLGVIGALVGRHDHVFHDRLNHASLIDAVGLSKCHNSRYRHVDMAGLEASLTTCRASRRWIVTDTVFSMDGDIAPLDDLARLAHANGAVLIGDDAHGIGVLAHGRGAGAAFELDQTAFPIQIVTFGKALGTAGAAVVGSNALIETLIQRSRTFIYDTAPPPMIAAATSAALTLIMGDQSIHRALTDNIAYFRHGAADLPLHPSTTPIQPIIIGCDATSLAIASDLRAAGIYARAIRPPTVPAGTARLRICISAAHTRADIDALVAALHGAFSRHLP